MLHRFSRRPKASRRQRIEVDLENAVVYAVGDIHGAYEELVSLEGKIAVDAASFQGPKLLILLGDFVDRGPDSARVIAHLLRPPPPGFQRICLAGNHELCMSDYLDGIVPLEQWLALGGIETLYSYGLDPVHLARLYSSRGEIDDYIRNSIPLPHRLFLQGLPTMAYSERVVFVHAGIRPGIPLDEQDDTDLTTIRSDFLDNAAKLDRLVVHGHTRSIRPSAEGRRFGIDTGAFETGRLTALRIKDRQGRLLSS